MVKKFFHKKSKRISCHKRFKIEKKVREHNRQKRKGDKKETKSKNRKRVIVLPDHVPNECPFIDEILDEFREMKTIDRENAIREKRRGTDAPAAEQLASAARAKFDEFAEVERLRQVIRDEQVHETENSMKAHYAEFRKVFEEADVILHVLDARDPLGTKCTEIEDAIRSSNGQKRLVFVLNKADLIPRDNLDAWMKYMRQKHGATIPFKASQQTQRSHFGQRKFHGINDKSMSNSVSAGTNLLMSLLNNYCRNRNIKTSITVGVVGLPNVGKSSVINSLKRRRACEVGAVAGVTKNLQVVQIDSKIKVIDSPGVVFSSIAHQQESSAAAAELNDGSLVLKNTINSQNIKDPEAAARLILRKLDRNQLIDQYKLEEFATPDEFLIAKAKQMGKVKRGGIADTAVVARLIIDDWNRGKLKHHTIPPPLEPNDFDVHLAAQIVDFEKGDEQPELNLDEDMQTVEPMVTEPAPAPTPVQKGFIEIDGKLLKVMGRIKKANQKKKMQQIGQKLKKLN